jgi:predicted MFS family arabinose efflux permease
VAGALLLNLGWVGAMQTLGLLVLLCLPAAFILKGSGAPAAPGQKPQSTGDAVRTALRDRSFLLLGAGFFVCGFHVAFLGTHLPGVVALCGLPVQYSAWALAVLGLFNIVGSISMGWAVGRWRMKSLLSLVYAARALGVLAFVLSPKSGAVVLVFAGFMGLTFLSTVPPTAGLVAKFFGPRHMATLFGVVMLTHQVGGFLGAWLGGKVFQATGSYDIVWAIDIALAVAAALVHLPIREAALPARGQATA